MTLYLGFDFGLSRIGIASGQTVTGTASPLDVVRAKQGKPDWDHLDRLIREWTPTALIVGLPLNMDGTDNPITTAARKFSNRLHGRYHLPCHLVDERLTTREARELTHQGGREIAFDGSLDTAAACIILQQYLDS